MLAFSKFIINLVKSSGKGSAAFEKTGDRMAATLTMGLNHSD